MNHEALQDLAWAVEQAAHILRELASGEYNTVGQMRRLEQLARIADRINAGVQEVHVE